MNATLTIPNPIIDSKEEDDYKKLSERYKKLIEPKTISLIGQAAIEKIPKNIRDKAAIVGGTAQKCITETELYNQCVNIIMNGFDVLEKTAAKISVNPKKIIEKLNEMETVNEVSSIDDICFAREYDIAKIVSSYKVGDIAYAFVEGAATGAPGFAGLPFNIVLSTFLYYRAVQSIAIHYGYDTKNNSDELEIASEVFMSALSPKSKGQSEISTTITKIMAMAELNVIKQTAKKTWSDMAARGGICLLITQMRALANRAAQNALKNVGVKGLEQNAFKNVFEQIGKGITKKNIGKCIPAVSAIIGALFDVSQMNTVLEYADIFYRKRFIAEKEVRINIQIEPVSVIDVTDSANI